MAEREDSLFKILYLRGVKGLIGYLVETAYVGLVPRIVVIVAIPCLLFFSSKIECTNRNSVYKENGPRGVFLGNKKEPLPWEGSLMRLKRKTTAARFCRSGKMCLRFNRKPASPRARVPIVGRILTTRPHTGRGRLIMQMQCSTALPLANKCSISTMVLCPPTKD
jgi:hypothetical protein